MRARRVLFDIVSEDSADAVPVNGHGKVGETEKAETAELGHRALRCRR